MSQIKADTDALRATIAAMRQGSSTIENALQQAAQAMTTLQSSRWSGNHRQQAEEVWTRLQAQFAPTIEALNQIAARTERFTNALEEAGRVFGDGMAHLPPLHTHPSDRATVPSRGTESPAPPPPGATPPPLPPNPPAISNRLRRRVRPRPHHLERWTAMLNRRRNVQQIAVDKAQLPSDVSAILNREVRLRNGAKVRVANLDGRTPVAGMDSIYGKPGQLPLKAVITSTSQNRHPDLYAAVIHQFGVEGNPRYAPDRYTYCNTFAGDVMRAMGVPLPTKADLGINKRDRATVGTQALYRWLLTKAGAQGWREVNPNTSEGLRLLQEHVNAGKPALAADEGHVAVIRPGQRANSVADLRIAQAGARNLNNVRLGDAGLGRVFRPRFFINI